MISPYSKKTKERIVRLLEKRKFNHSETYDEAGVVFNLSTKIVNRKGSGFNYYYGVELNKSGLMRWVKGDRWQLVEEVPEEIEEAFPDVKAMRDLIRNENT